jgi:hypothetical protein
MGLFARWFGTDPSARVEKAQKMLDKGEYNEARWELDGVDHPAADGLRARAMAGLAALNLAEAEARFNAGDVPGAQEHLGLAREFGATEADLRAARQAARELRDRQKAEQAAKAAQAATIEGDDPLWSLPPDDPRLRYAMQLEGWPEDLRARLAALGPGFALAVQAVEEGRGAEAARALAPFVARDPVAAWERARALLLVGDLPGAADELRRFGEAVGHRRLGPQHSGVLLAQLLAQTGQGEAALQVLDAELARGPDLAVRGSRASLLEALGRHADAGKEAEALLQIAPKDQGLYRMVARTRLHAGDRVGAAAVLEANLAHTCSNPGKCGSQPFDAEAARLLARIYLEDRALPGRVTELLREIEQRADPGTAGWEDRYLTALVARNNGNEGLAEMTRVLLAELPPGDPRAQRVQVALGRALSA